jgi:hypothetical protein
MLLFPERRFHPNAGQLNQPFMHIWPGGFFGQFEALARVRVVFFRFGQDHDYTTRTVELTFGLCDMALTYVNPFVEIATQLWRSGTRSETLCFRRFYPYLPENEALPRNQMGAECVEMVSL